MPDVPDTLVLKRHRDFAGRRYTLWPRWAILGLLTLFCVLGLLNVFGQRPSTVSAGTPAAKLTLYAPTKLRGGLLFSARFHITAVRELKNATLVLDPGWAEGMAINTVEPSPLGQGSRNGRLTFQLGHVPAGESYLLFMEFQVNPTNVAWRRPQNVELDDGDTKLLTVKRSVVIYP
ncbi:MAG: hypothetical protein QOH16_1773 [Gaiellaceae bacterium]|nr:hypothetical protein [Gaiellaceae bacterium]